MRNRLRTTAGFTMIEMMISLVILVVAGGGMMAASTSAMTLNQSAKEHLLAKEAAVQTFETIRSYALDNYALTYVKFNGTTGDDPLPIDEDGYAVNLVVGTVTTTTVKQYETYTSPGGGPSTIIETSAAKPRMAFSVPALQAIDPNAVVIVDFPGSGVELYEDAVGFDFGGPMDLTGDGIISGVDVSGSYERLPITVTVNWINKSGRRNSVSYHSIMADRR